MSSNADCVQMRARLKEAEDAYHRIITGGGTTWVAFGGGRSVSYSAANAGELRAYINALRDRIAACCGDATSSASAGRRAPIRFRF